MSDLREMLDRQAREYEHYAAWWERGLQRWQEMIVNHAVRLMQERERLLRRVEYGGKKGRRAARRLRNGARR